MASQDVANGIYFRLLNTDIASDQSDRVEILYVFVFGKTEHVLNSKQKAEINVQFRVVGFNVNFRRDLTNVTPSRSIR